MRLMTVLLGEPADNTHMTTRTTANLLLVWLLLGTNITAGSTDEAGRGQAAVVAADVVLKGGTLIDGTGAPARRADVAVRGDRIVAVGSFPIDPRRKVIDVSSLVVAPGFIDLHTHSDDGITEARTRLNLNYLTQGVTTVVTGNCGSGPVDVAKYLAAIDAHGAGTNVIHLVPHGVAAQRRDGHCRPAAEPAELDRMKQLVGAGMAAGAWGMATRPDLCSQPLRQHGRADRAGEGGGRHRAGSTPRTSATRKTGCSRRSTRRSRSASRPACRCTSRT